MNAKNLKFFAPQKNHFIAFDSDGCALNTMEQKQKECFIPNIIKSWNLELISDIARETAEFVNLYSKYRGGNRFPSLIRVFELLRERREVNEQNVEIPGTQSLISWVEGETKLGNASLKVAAQTSSDPVLLQTLRWSEAVDHAVSKIQCELHPFPLVRECLQNARGFADMIVVSMTPLDALQKEWESNQLIQFIQFIASPDIGTKPEQIAHATQGRYAPDHILVLGDAMGDLAAAQSNHALFYPILPGNEISSWEEFHSEGLDRFLGGTFAGIYQDKLLERFVDLLPTTPSW